MLFKNRERPTRDEVITAYRLLLGRDPEDKSAIAIHRRIRSLIDLMKGIAVSEAELVRECPALLMERVAYAVIGTHSRQIEGRLFDDLLDAGWVLEIERPALIGLDETGPRTTFDGVQSWRHPGVVARPGVSG